MATGGQKRIDGSTAKNAVAKAARPLRALLANHRNIEVLVQSELLKQNEPQENVIRAIKERVEHDPQMFWILLDKVSSFSNCEEAVKRLRAHSHAGDKDPKQAQDQPNAVRKFRNQTVLGDLWENLKLLEGIKGTESDTAIRTMIRTTIDKQKDMTCIKLMEEELSQMQQEELISTDLYEYAIDEVRKKKEATIVDFDKLVDHSPPPELRKDDLYHASLCCTVVNKSNDTEQCKRLLHALSYKSLKQLSISQGDDTGEFPRCMIAVSSDNSQATTCYVAFENMLNFKQWEQLSDDHNPSSFGEVLEYQINKFPTLYLEAVIKRENRLILTGFSFGGVLAQMLAARLWQLPQISTAQLKSNVFCITFGQPLIKGSLITQAADLFPEYNSTVHAITSENDTLPSIIEKFDTLTSKNEAGLSHVLQNLSCVQEYYSISNGIANGSAFHEADPCLHENSSSESQQNSTLDSQGCDQSAELNPKVSKAESELQKLLHSQHKDPDVEMKLTPKRYLIKFKGSDLSFCEMPQLLQESLEFNRMDAEINRECFVQHSAGAYYSVIKVLAYNHEENKIPVHCPQISSDFLNPIIERVKVTQYGKAAIVAIEGQRLWFVHSVKLLSITKEPLHLQESFVSIKAELDDSVMSGNQREVELVVFSRFSQAITRKIHMELDPNRLSPRGRQLARLEPARLLELAFMTALLEKRANRCSQSPVHSGEPPHFLTYFKRFLHDIAAVVPYESILCAIAHCHNKRISEDCMRSIKSMEFPFSLTSYISSFVAALRIQHEKTAEANAANLYHQFSFEECATFMWLKAKYNGKSVKSFSRELFTDSFIFGSLEELYEETLSLRTKAQNSLEQISSLDEAKAISDKSTRELFLTTYGRRSKEEASMLKSPILILIEGREILHHTSNKPNLQSDEERQLYEKTVEVLRMARGGQFDVSIGVICGFMYQHVRVPFTEVNPITFLKTLQYRIGPFKDVLKSDSNFWASIVERCRNAVSKGSRVAEHTYHGKLKFLVTEIDPGSKAHIDPISSEHSMYMLEMRLKELCDSLGISKEKSVGRMVESWRTLFVGLPIADVATTHRSLVFQWIKWSLMIHELRRMLETHVTIAIAGLVNSGKTQLIRSLFGFNVKAGTIELHRTIVPFMYSLAPEVDGVYVIDLPGADDSDKNVSQLTEFLKFISQIVLFVVSYDKAHTKAAKKWLETFETRNIKPNEPYRNHNVVSDHYFEHSRFNEEDEPGVPILVCMTYADRLLSEEMDENGKYHTGNARKAIAENLGGISMKCFNQGIRTSSGNRTLDYYCFCLSQSKLTESDMKAVDIRIPTDVGNWICDRLREQLPKESETPGRLEKYLKQSYRGLKE